MTPTITTDSMRTVMQDPKFDFILLCNKIAEPTTSTCRCRWWWSPRPITMRGTLT